MNSYRRNAGDGLSSLFSNLLRGRGFNRGAAWGMMIIGALLAFEIFNFSTTQFALLDVLGDLSFGVSAGKHPGNCLCGIDFAALPASSRPNGSDEPKEIYISLAPGFGSCFNAMLPGGVFQLHRHHASQYGGAVISTATMTKLCISRAAMILLIRVLIIGTFSLAGDRLFTTSNQRAYNNYPQQQTQTYRPATSQPIMRSASSLNRPAHVMQNQNQNTFRPAPKLPVQQTSFTRPEPTYHPVASHSAQSTDRSYDA